MTRERLQHHAERFGTEGVMEVAIQYRLPFEELVRLQEHIDQIDQSQRRYRKPTRRRLTVEQRVKRLLGIEEGDESGSDS